MMHYLIWLSCLLPLAAAAASPTPTQDLAPTGTLRVAMNFGNPVLVQRDPASGEPRGVAAALARELARRLGVPLTFVPFDSAGQVTDAIPRNAWDIAFLAVDPVRAKQIDFTAPYVLIEGSYVVPAASPLHTADDVDRDGVRVMVDRASAYDLYLTRTLKHATLVRPPATDTAEAFLANPVEVLAGVRQPLEALVKLHPELRLLPGRFMVINQAMATPKGRTAGAAYLRSFVEDAKASGFVARALADSGQAAAVVAPPAD
jgi:polar amino acid transport system substrate-binding protein